MVKKRQTTVVELPLFPTESNWLELSTLGNSQRSCQTEDSVPEVLWTETVPLRVRSPLRRETLLQGCLTTNFSSAHSQGIIAGVDEVGRGALFGPVVAAAVVLPRSALPELMLAGINDSKKLSPSRRNQLAQQICTLACDWRIGFASTAEIDQINILQASLLAMKRAVLKLSVQPTLCLIDGNQLVPGLPMPQQTIIKGDSLSIAIAAASILAKVWRDDLILRLAVNYPMYDLVRNKGYGSQRHLAALREHGVSRLHRKSFSPCQN